MKLLGRTEKVVKRLDKNKNGEEIPHLETTEVVSDHCNVVNNGYQSDSRVL